MKKTYVVFGGSGGIGFESAKLFKDGNLVIVDINEEALEGAKLSLEKLNIKTYTMTCDVTNIEDVANVAKFASSLGEIKTVVNAAGLSSVVPNAPLIMKVNLVGSAIIAQAFLPYANPGMVMVYLGSMLGYLIPRDGVYDELVKDPLSPDFMEKIMPVVDNDPKKTYGLSKFGVHRLCESQAFAWGEKGARILSVSPGVVNTQMSKDSPGDAIEVLRKKTPLQRHAEPEEIARLIKFLTSSDASFITGSDVRIDGGLIHHLMTP